MEQKSQALDSETSGRVRQKRRTRNAIVHAARSILDRGERPTVAQAAEEAEVSRTTAYRYFPTQESLLLELSVTVSLGEIEALLAQPFDGIDPADRLLELVDTFNRYVTANEVLFRTTQRHYLDTWLAAERAGHGHDHQLRAGRRRQWISDALEPLQVSVPRAELRRMESALCLAMGGEAFAVLRDICQLEPDEAVDIMRWTAQAILAVGLSTGRASPFENPDLGHPSD
jgi:AcrR family transcriptional regulator